MFRPAFLVMAFIPLSAGGSLAAPADAALKAQDAATALVRGDANQAVTSYTEALKDPALPNDRRATILNDRAVAYARIGQTKLAIDDFNRAAQLFPSPNPIQLGQQLFQQLHRIARLHGPRSKQSPAVRLVQRVLQLGFGIPRIDADRDGADAHRAHEGPLFAEGAHMGFIDDGR